MIKKYNIFHLLKLGRQFANIAYADTKKSYLRKQKNKITFYTILNPFFTRKWFNLLSQEPFNEILQYRPALYIKPYRPYISTKFNKQKKIKIIRDTYDFLKSKNLFNPFMTNEKGIELAKIIDREGKEYFLRLLYLHRCRKEGELVLSLQSNETYDGVAFVAFSVEKIGSEYVCRIGCIQGDLNKKSFKKIQKTLYGLRPNAFIIFALQEICKNWQCSAIYAASDKIQAYRKQHLIFLPGIHSIKFDYDRFWTETGGKKYDKYWFVLPNEYIRKDFSNIKSQKRSLYKKRYDTLDKIAIQIKENLQKVD